MRTATVYKIFSDETDKIYIGSTSLSLEKRLILHKSSYKRYLAGKHEYVSSFEIIKLNNVAIEELESFPFESNKETHKRERWYIELNNDKVVNIQIPGKDLEECSAAYIEVYNKLPKICNSCNICTSLKYMSKHRRTNKHKENRDRIKKMIIDHDKILRDIEENIKQNVF